MTNEEKRIVIAEACGWKFRPEHDVGYNTPAGRVYPECWVLDNDEEHTVACEDGLPDYLNDLNAMHEAEKCLTYEQLDKYVTLLFDWAQEEALRHSPSKNAIKEPWGQYSIKASASIKAEMFLAAIGKL